MCVFKLLCDTLLFAMPLECTKGEVGKMEEKNCTRAVERSRSQDAMEVTCVGEGYDEREYMLMVSRAGKVVCSSLELARLCPQQAAQP